MSRPSDYLFEWTSDVACPYQTIRQYRNSLFRLYCVRSYASESGVSTTREENCESLSACECTFVACCIFQGAYIAGPVTFRWIYNLNPGLITF